MKARDIFAAVRSTKVAGAPRRRLAALAVVALALSLALGVALAGAVAPVLTIEDASNVQYTTADANGEVNPEGKGTSFHFEYATEADFSNANGVGYGYTEATTPASAQLTGLQPGTTYHLRLVASNEDGETQVEAANTFTTKAVAKPLVSSLAASEAEFSGLVNPNAPKDATELGGGSPEEEAINGAFATHWSFTCDPGCNFAGESAGDLEADDDAHAVSATPTGLTPNQPYTVTLHATNAGGEETETLVDAFTTPAIKPDIARETLWEPTSSSIQLNSLVNAHNDVLTDCHFEWGTSTAYGNTAPCESELVDGTYSAPSDNADHIVSARLSGLDPATTYHFRLVAANATGETQGDDRTYTTYPEAQPESCSNQAIRDAQHSNQLGHCRAWEKVTPQAKGGGDIVADGITTIASGGGDAVAFNTRTPFGDTIGSGVSGQTQYVARRGAGGWSPHAVTPTANPEADQTFFATLQLQTFSEDLRTAVVWSYDLPAASNDVPFRQNIYVEDTQTRGLQPLTLSSYPLELVDFIEPTMWGLSDDAHHLALVSSTQLLPEAASGASNVYMWDDGTLRLAGKLPDGTVPATGSEVLPSGYRKAMSADGTRQLFSAASPTGGPTQLYQRIDNSRTVWISQPEGSDQQSDPVNVHLQAATPDGRNVLFVTDSPLLDEDENEGPDLYLYSDSSNPTADDNLTLISHSGLVAAETNGDSVLGVSEDGSRVYYQTVGTEILVWSQGTTRLVSGSVNRPSDPSERLSAIASRPGHGRMTPDGRYFAFISNHTTDVGQVHGPTGQVTGGRLEMYQYNFINDTLRCVSCPAANVASDARVTASVPGGSITSVTNGDPQITNVAVRPRFLSSHGRVFFSTGEALVPEDVNGVFDAYEYDPETGTLALLSSGKGSTPSAFADASASGGDVFIATRQPLSDGDSDQLVDLYDVRVGGGFNLAAQQQSSGCVGEACQAGGSSPPSAVAIGSALGARGNVKKQRRHRHCRRAKKRAGKCHVKKGKRGNGHQRSTKQNGRAGK